MHGSDPDSQPGNLIPKNKLGKRETPSTWGKKEEDFQWEKTVKNPGGEDLKEQASSMAEHFPGHGEILVFNSSGCMENFPCLCPGRLQLYRDNFSKFRFVLAML